MDNPAPRPTRKSTLIRVAAFFFIVLPLVIAANLAIWAAFNQPHEAEAWTGEIVGFSYSPYQRDQDPSKGVHPTHDQIAADLKLLSGTAQAIRTYSVIRGLEDIPALAAQDGLSVSLGVWISGDKQRNDEEMANLLQLWKERNVVRV